MTEQQIAELIAKERREFAWAEEYMAKSRALTLELEDLRARLRDLRDQWLEEAKDADAHTQCDLETCAEALTALLVDPLTPQET